MRKLIDVLTRPEVDAPLEAADKYTRIGRGDHALLLTTLQTGLRLSEATGLKRQDVTVDTGAHVEILGKGRKQRAVPICKPAADVHRSAPRSQCAAETNPRPDFP